MCEALSSNLTTENKEAARLQLHGGLPCSFGPAWELCRKEGDCFCELHVLGTLSAESLFGYEVRVVRTLGSVT